MENENITQLQFHDGRKTFIKGIQLLRHKIHRNVLHKDELSSCYILMTKN